MAVNPTPPREPRIGSQPQRKLLPPPVDRSEAGRAPKAEETGQKRQGLISRLKTAVTDDEIDGQIMRMFKLLAQGLINLAAPRGSYLNILT
ncbi:MAG: hypothetical protein FJX54_01430 [Alphaproteobacteria bacterium]|nr:hypothetical protein [Alphaproteobacteria bacterium]